MQHLLKIKLDSIHAAMDNIFRKFLLGAIQKVRTQPFRRQRIYRSIFQQIEQLRKFDAIGFDGVWTVGFKQKRFVHPFECSKIFRMNLADNRFPHFCFGRHADFVSDSVNIRQMAYTF